MYLPLSLTDLISLACGHLQANCQPDTWRWSYDRTFTMEFHGARMQAVAATSSTHETSDFSFNINGLLDERKHNPHSFFTQIKPFINLAVYSTLDQLQEYCTKMYQYTPIITQYHQQFDNNQRLIRALISPGDLTTRRLVDDRSNPRVVVGKIFLQVDVIKYSFIIQSLRR